MNIPITKPYFDSAELEIVQKPILSGWVVQGPYVKQFEKEIAQYTGAKYSVALNSCTSGQFILSRIIELSPGDEVIVPSFTWISTVNSIEYTGAKAVFCDIDITTFNIDVSAIESKITPYTKAIYPVHLFGLPAAMNEIMDIAKKYELHVIEDCACGLMGRINEQHCGTFGDAGVFSFHPRKSITTGEGGMIITNNHSIFEKASAYKEHGAYTTDLERHNSNDSFLLTEYKELGYNYRMTDIQGAMGVAQSQKIDVIFSKKQDLSKEYISRINKINWLQAPQTSKGYVHGYQAFVTLFKPEEALKAIREKDVAAIDSLHLERNVIMRSLEKKGIATRQGTHAVHIQKLYMDKYSLKATDFITSYAADRLTVALPFYPHITNEEKDYLFSNLKSVRI